MEKQNLKLTAPKYDPCRLFRKGDVVRLVPFNGRAPIMYGSNVFGIEEVLTVAEDENKEYEVLVNGTSARQIFPACFLELVTPMEELEPYYIVDDDLDDDFSFFAIQNRNSIMSHDLEEEVARYVYGTEYTADKETVRKRAEAERDRLNAEFRKEQK